jgi:hypothetical protein
MLYNINPIVWGESFWNVIHFITIAYPDTPTEEDKQNVKTFLKSLQHVLPCETCRNHFKSNLITYPITDEVLSSRYNFISWAVTVHNEVNRRTGKPEMSVDEAINLYTTKKQYDYSQIITIVLLILLIILIIFYIKTK